MLASRTQWNDTAPVRRHRGGRPSEGMLSRSRPCLRGGHGAAGLALAALAGGAQGRNGEEVEGARLQAVRIEAALAGGADELPVEGVGAGAHEHVVHTGTVLALPAQGYAAAAIGSASLQVLLFRKDDPALHVNDLLLHV
jgi:hypothetical protein